MITDYLKRRMWNVLRSAHYAEVDPCFTCDEMDAIWVLLFGEKSSVIDHKCPGPAFNG